MPAIDDDEGSDLFGWGHARGSDPDTSHDAVPRNIPERARRVLRSYLFSGRPLIDHEACRMAGFNDAVTHQRCSDLRHAKFIERTADKGLTPSGKAAYKCRITDRGVTYLIGGDHG